MHRRIPSILGPAGRLALADVVRDDVLLAFDFDGTLAPLVDRPEDAAMAPLVAGRLEALNRLVPVAVISGRGRRDLLERLGFDPSFAIGNHGAEDAQAAHTRVAAVRTLDALRARLDERRALLAACGVWVEDKGLSLALHYRGAEDATRARQVIRKVLRQAGPQLRGFGGKFVVNVVPEGLPDKADALFSLVQRCEAAAVLYVGDDVNDEPVFARAPAHWVTVQVGPAPRACSARFALGDQPRMADVLGVLVQGFATRRADGRTAPAAPARALP